MMQRRVQTIPAGIMGVRSFAPRSAPVTPAGWWVVAGKTCVAAYQAKGAASYAASKSNLANPGTYDAADAAAYPTWNTTTGWTFNGSTQYLTTGVTPGRDWSVLCQFANVTNGGVLLGSQPNGAPYFGLQPNNIPNSKAGYWHEQFLLLSPVMSGGNMAFAAASAYRDGAKETESILTSSGSYLAMFIGGWNGNGTLANAYAGDILAVAFYSDTLTDGQIATVAAAMAAL